MFFLLFNLFSGKVHEAAQFDRLEGGESVKVQLLRRGRGPAAGDGEGVKAGAEKAQELGAAGHYQQRDLSTHDFPNNVGKAN